MYPTSPGTIQGTTLSKPPFVSPAGGVIRRGSRSLGRERARYPLQAKRMVEQLRRIPPRCEQTRGGSQGLLREPPTPAASGEPRSQRPWHFKRPRV